MKKRVFCIALACALTLSACNTSESSKSEGETPQPTIYHSAVPTSKPPKTPSPVRTVTPEPTLDTSYIAEGFPSVLSKDTLTAVRNRNHVTMTSTTAGGAGNDETADKLFDSEVETKLCTNDTGYVIAWHLDRPYKVGGYSITTANDSEQYGRLPKGWKLEASADGSRWTEVAYVTSGGMRNSNFTEYFYPLRKPGTYQYFRFTLTAPTSGMTQMSEITLYVVEE